MNIKLLHISIIRYAVTLFNQDLILFLVKTWIYLFKDLFQFTFKLFEILRKYNLIALLFHPETKVVVFSQYGLFMLLIN